MQEHQTESDVAGLHVVLHSTRVGKCRRRLTIHDMPRRLVEEHVTYVASPSRVVVFIELINGDLSEGYCEEDMDLELTC